MGQAPNCLHAQTWVDDSIAAVAAWMQTHVFLVGQAPELLQQQGHPALKEGHHSVTEVESFLECMDVKHD